MIVRQARRAAVLALVVALGACGGGGSREVATGRGTPSGAEPVVGGGQEVECGGTTFDSAALSEAPPLASLADGPAGAVNDIGDPAFDPSEDWRIVSDSDRHVNLLRELERPLDSDGGDTHTHEARGLSLITGATNVADGTWLLTSAGTCTPRLVTGGDLGAADLTLANVPSPAATTLDLLVGERACASGETADGRVEVIELIETDEQVQLRVGVAPRDGDQSCQGNPLTPFAVELSAPVGDREVVDSSIVPPRPLVVGPG